MATRTTGRARGFVEMPDATEAQAAMEGLDGTVLGGRTLHVRAARHEQDDRYGSGRPRW
jgi:RNA recognition motif-containing protein